MTRSLVPSIKALERAIAVLARAAAREAQASVGVNALFGNSQPALNRKMQERAFDLHQIVDFLQTQVDMRHPVSVQKEDDEEEFDSLVVTLFWKTGVCAFKTSVSAFSKEEVARSPDPEVKNWVYWTERAVSEMNASLGTTLRLQDVRRSVVAKKRIGYNTAQ